SKEAKGITLVRSTIKTQTRLSITPTALANPKTPHQPHRRKDRMKHAPVIVGITATMLLTACGGQAQDNAWFEENCPVQISDVREHFEQGGPTGKVVTTAMTQGPMNPPAGLDDSQHARIGLYTNDEPSGSMELEREI